MNDSRCKNCGAPIAIPNDSRTVRCEYCGSVFELDLNRAHFANLYSAADDAWDRRDFDEALKYYLQITEEDNLQSEAHWGAALCRYGIAYELDPISGKKKPTCNRINNDSIFEDKNYIAAIKHASPENKQKYLVRATEIDRISVEFLKIVKNESPYDVFISYKRTDERGLRTLEAEHAMRLYLYLKNHGIMVFFAEESLKNVAGSLYEPYIFAALHSAKVMVLMGSSKENIEAVWVKNEWQRFLKLMATSPEKALIPAYIGDPYQVLPQRFQPLQAFNMGSPVFVEEVLENIKKKLSDCGQQENAANVGNGNAQQATLGSLLERAYMFVNDGEYEKSAQQLEKVLDIDPKCAEAYMCGLMIEFRVKKEAQLSQVLQRIDLSHNYKKIMAFGSEELKKRLSYYSACIMDRLGKAELMRQEVNQKKSALNKMIADSNNVLNEIDKKRNEIKKRIEKEQSAFSVLSGRIADARGKLEAFKKEPRSFPILTILLMLMIDATAFAYALLINLRGDDGLTFFLIFFLPAVVLFTIVARKSMGIGAPFVGVGILCVTFIIAAICNGGGLISAILGVLYDVTLGLIFGDKKVLTAENLAMAFFFAGQVVYIISVIFCIVKISNKLNKRKTYKNLKKQMIEDEKEYAAKTKQNLILAQLQNSLIQYDTYYNNQFNSIRSQLLRENREYLDMAQKAGQKAEDILPMKYR